MQHATIFSVSQPGPQEQMFWEANYWDAVVNRDGRMDGIFYYAVLSTGVYCRPGCASRQPKRENVLFFDRRDRAEQAGFRACKRCRPERVIRPDPQLEAVEKACRYIEARLEEPLTLPVLSKELGLSPFHLQRTFKELMGITPKDYADACRMRQLRSGLREGHSVTHALYEAGYGSSSRLYERSSSHLGMTPAAFRKGGAGVAIRYSIAESAFGKLLVAATKRGLCMVEFGDSVGELAQSLRREFRSAILIEEQPWPTVEALLARLNGQSSARKLPLDIQATAFQRRVWEHLQSIPAGKTQSYSQVAEAIGAPTATRAVARACASNPVAIAIPCHRVVRADGNLGGYRWGVERKKAILDAEAQH